MSSVSTRVEQASFVVVILVVTVAFVWLLLPFYGAVFWAIVLAILFNPLQRRLERGLKGRRGWAAALSVLACICLVMIPAAIILSALAQEAAGFYSRLQSEQTDMASIMQTLRDALPSFVTDMLARFNLGSLEEIQQRIVGAIGEGAQTITTSLVSMGQGTAELFVSVGVMLYVLFFLFRDGPALTVKIRRASSLNVHHTDYIFAKFSSVVKATVKGNVIIALIQGAIGGITLWLLGMPAALLWGVLMAVLSLLPAVGSFIVWGPIALFLLLSGAYAKGIVLILVGVFVIGLVDNLLRPPLVGAGTRMPDYVVLVSTLGGIALIGLNGFVVGPLIAALFIAVWSLFTEDREQLAPDGRTPT